MFIFDLKIIDVTYLTKRSLTSTRGEVCRPISKKQIEMYVFRVWEVFLLTPDKSREKNTNIQILYTMQYYFF